MLNSMSLAVAALLATALPGYAAEQYDGSWVADAPAAGGVGAGTSVPTGCEAVRIPFKVSDNQISGNLERSTYGTGRVQANPSGTPITGTVQPDGSFNAQWQNYHATGKLVGNKVEVHWNGECGPRVATGTRVATAAESTGATMAPGTASSPHDGEWVVDAQAVQSTGQTIATGCEAVRIPFRISDNRVSGNLQRSTYGTGRVHASPSGAPITGTVAPDGTINAQWQGYRATGQIVGNQAEIRWDGECGERIATGGRVSATAGESAGSSTGTPATGTVGTPPPGTAYQVPQGAGPQGVHH